VCIIRVKLSFLENNSVSAVNREITFSYGVIMAICSFTCGALQKMKMLQGLHCEIRANSLEQSMEQHKLASFVFNVRKLGKAALEHLLSSCCSLISLL